MSTKAALPAILGLSVLGAGCATTPPEEDPVAIKLNDLDRRLERLERVLSNQSLLELSQQIQASQTELRTLRGKVEEVEHRASQADGRQRSAYADLDKRIQELKAAQAQAMAQPGLEMPGALPVPGGSDRANYQASIEQLRNGRYEQAVGGLQQFLLSFPDSSLAGNAKYWLGEGLSMMGRYPEARAALERVGREHPNSPAAADAAKKLAQMSSEGQ